MSVNSSDGSAKGFYPALSSATAVPVAASFVPQSVYVQKAPQQYSQQQPSPSFHINIEREPLIQGKQKKQKARCCGPCFGTCCGIIFGVSCALFCCLLIAAGITAAVFFSICSHGNERTLDFSIDARNVTNFQFTTSNGAVTIIQSSDVYNLTISSEQHAKSEEAMNALNGTWHIEGNTFFYQENESASEGISCPSWSKVTITIPASYSLVDVSSVSTNGYIQVINVTSSSLTIKTSNGYISVDSISAEVIKMETTNGKVTNAGPIRVLPGSSSQITATTTNGKVELASVNVANITNGAFKFSTTNGHVEVGMSQYSGLFTIKTTNGDISVTGQGVHVTNSDDDMKTGYVGSPSTGNGINVSTSNGEANLSFDS